MTSYNERAQIPPLQHSHHRTLLRFASLITHRNRVRQEGFRQEVQMNVNRVLRVQLARRELLVAPPAPLVPPVDT